MKNTIKVALSAGVLSLGVMSYQAALAAPVGAYVNVLGGADYLTGSGMSNMNFAASEDQTSGSINYANPTPNYTNSELGYTGRAAAGYFFNTDPLNSWAFGVEAGYNYLSPIKSSTTQNTPVLTHIYTVNGASTTNAWAADLDFVISEDISEHASLIYKLGAAYEATSQTFTSTTVSPNDGFYNGSSSSSNSGVGIDGGLGLKYAFSKHVAAIAELDGMKGGKNIGYAQGLVGLAFMF